MIFFLKIIVLMEVVLAIYLRDHSLVLFRLIKMLFLHSIKACLINNHQKYKDKKDNSNKTKSNKMNKVKMIMEYTKISHKLIQLNQQVITSMNNHQYYTEKRYQNLKKGVRICYKM
jgi:hypothetical protein